MARPGLTQHRKFARLSRLLGNAPLALGCLELMWEKCYQNGDDYLGDEIDVEAAALWPGESGVLCRALLNAGGEGKAGFIEPVEGRPGIYQCHDLFDHAPQYVGKRLKREIERRERGLSLAQMRADAGRKGGKATKQKATKQQTGSKREANGKPLAQDCKQIATTPAPAPAPAPAPSTTSLRSVEPSRLPIEDTPGDEESALALWREIAEPAGLPKVLQLDAKRRIHLKARLKEKGWLDLFREAITYAARHPDGAWMRGEGARRWKADLDHFLKPGKVLATVEKARAAGTGAARASPAAINPSRRCATADAALDVQLAGMSFPEIPLLAAGAP